LKGVVSRTHWNTLLQKTPPELGSKAKAQEDDLPTEETGQGWVSLQYVLEAASISGGARALSSRLSSLSIELETSVVNPVLSTRLSEDLKPFISKLLEQERELKLSKRNLVELREAVEVLLNTVKVDFQNELLETCYHTRVRSLLNSVLFLLRVPEEVTALCSMKTDNYSNFLKISELFHSAMKILSQTEFISCDGLDQIRGEILKLKEKIGSQISDILHVQLFLGATDLSFLLVEFNLSEDSLLKERLTNLLSALLKLECSAQSGKYLSIHFRQRLVALMERCIAEARELYLRRSPVARVKDEPRGYDLLSRSGLVSGFPVLWRGLNEEDSRRLLLFIKVLTSAFLEVLYRFRLVKDLFVKFEEEDSYPALSSLWFTMQQMVVVELGYLLETEYPNMERNDSAVSSRSSFDGVPLRSKGLRERFDEKVAKSRLKSNTLHDSYKRESMDDSFLEASLEPVHSSGRTAEGQLTSLANQTCYWLGLQPSVLWSPVIYDAIVAFYEKAEALVLKEKQPVSNDVNSRLKRATSENSNDHVLFVFLEGFLKNQFCKVAAERIDHEIRRLCSESDSFTTVEPSSEVAEGSSFDQSLPPAFSMKNLYRRKLLDSYRIGSCRIFKCCLEACHIIEEAHSLEVFLKESSKKTGAFNLLMAPLCSRFGDTFLRIIKALLAPFWSEQVLEWVMQYYQDKSDITSLANTVSLIRGELSVDTLNMISVMYNSTCFLLEPLYLRSAQNSTADSEEANSWMELRKINQICIKIFELECMNLIESCLRSCESESRRVSCCTAKFLEQRFPHFFNIAKQCRGLFLLNNVSNLIHEYAVTFLLKDCKYIESQNDEKNAATVA